MQSSHELYIVLNENGTIYCDKNREYRMYKTKEGLEKQKDKYKGKKIAVFKLTDIQEIDELIKSE